MFRIYTLDRLTMSRDRRTGQRYLLGVVLTDNPPTHNNSTVFRNFGRILRKWVTPPDLSTRFKEIRSSEEFEVVISVGTFLITK